MGEAGIFGEDERLELLNGEILAMNPIGVLHAQCVNRLTQPLVLALGGDAIASVQNPVMLGPHDEPQPDTALFRPHTEHRPDHPTPGDVFLVIEVAGSTLAYDRDAKLPRYGGAEIPETWIVDLPGRVITRSGAPTTQGYRVTTNFYAGEVVVSTTRPNLQLAVDEILAERLPL